MLKPLAGPAVVWLVVAFVLLAVFADLSPAFWLVALAGCMAALIARHARTERRWRPILSIQPTLMSGLCLTDLVNREFSDGELCYDDATLDEVVRLLRSRRLVVLSGEPVSGRAKLAVEALRKTDFSRYRRLSRSPWNLAVAVR